jgi:hypothetical protein
MKYLYGDATPFPLDENFIETLSAATDACVALFQVDLEMRDRQERAASIRQRSLEELGYLDRLSQTVESALTPLLPGEEAIYAAQRTASTIARSARAAVEQARESVIREREAAIKNTIGNDLASRVLEATNDFVLSHQLPKTRWGISWSYNWESAQTELLMTATSECGLATELMGSIPSDERWSVPLRIADVDPHTQLTIQRSGSWLSRLFRGSHESISGFYITQIELRDKEARFKVHRSLKPGAVGYEVRVRGASQSSPLVCPIGTNREDAEPIPVYGDDAVNLTSLWGAVEKELRTLVRFRTRMLRASLHNNDIAGLEEPAELAEVILMTLAPFVREMRLRSRVPGELVLKRELGNGRREELFVPRQALESKFTALPHEQQRYFQAAGLGSEATVEFVQRTYPREIEPGYTDEMPTQIPRLALEGAGNVVAA